MLHLLLFPETLRVPRGHSLLPKKETRKEAVSSSSSLAPPELARSKAEKWVTNVFSVHYGTRSVT